MLSNILNVLLFSAILTTVCCGSYTPIVIWHGIADTCCGQTITGRMQTNLKQYLPGSHVVSLQIRNSTKEDYDNSLTMHPNKQIDIACNIIRSDPALAKGYNAIGLSQGSQLMRGVAQRCPEPRMKTLITMAGQHQGVYGIPECDEFSKVFCNLLRRAVNLGVYRRLVQNRIVPATYWHTPMDKSDYVKGSTYLADINNEKHINQAYIKNLQSLENFVMVKHGSDGTVIPIESSWFGFYKEGQAQISEGLRESELYQSDRLGLKQMDIDGKLHFVSNTWEHAEFEWNWFKKNIVDKYLK